MKLLKFIVTLSAFLICMGLYAQQKDEARPAPPKLKTPEEIAKIEADKMKTEVNLSDKQYKKVYNLVKKDHQYRQEQAQKQFGGGMPPQGGGPGMGMPEGMGGPGGGMGGPGGGMGMPGGMGGPGGGMGGPGGGMPPEMGQGQRPEGHPGMRPGGDVVSEEYLEKQDQKLKKILTEEQYNKWRSKHPAEHLELPPIEMNVF